MQLQVKVAFWSGNWVQRTSSHENTIISCVFVSPHPLRKGIWLKCAIIYELCILNAPLVLLLQLLNLPDHRQRSNISSGRAQSTSGSSLQLCRLKRGCRLNTVRIQAEKWLVLLTLCWSSKVCSLSHTDCSLALWPQEMQLVQGPAIIFWGLVWVSKYSHLKELSSCVVLPLSSLSLSLRFSLIKICKTFSFLETRC